MRGAVQSNVSTELQSLTGLLPADTLRGMVLYTDYQKLMICDEW
jgi:hypothetical protein